MIMIDLPSLILGVVIGALAGILAVMPFRVRIRRRVQLHDIAELRAQLHAAITELEAGHPRIDYATGVDRGLGYGTRSGLG
mgnify:CR=1 FL=1